MRGILARCFGLLLVTAGLLSLVLPSLAGARETAHPATRFTIRAVAAPASQQHHARAALAQAAAAATPTTPFSECPAIGNDSSCELLVDVTNSNTLVYQDSSQGPYDGSDDTLVGVINESNTTVSHLSLGGNSDIFAFDGDGICSGQFTGTPAGCPFGSTGYEGPGTSFSNYASGTSGDVTFTGGLAPGATAYFSLEEALDSSAVVTGGPGAAEQGGPINLAENRTTCGAGDPVNCATGTFWHTFTDIQVPGNGVALDLARTYSASQASTDGPFGHGWTGSYDMRLSTDSTSHDVTVVQEDGAAVTFAPNGSGGFTAPQRVLASLTDNGDGTYTYKRNSDQVQNIFDATSGQLLKQVDRNGYSTTLSYSGGQLGSVTDPSGRTITFAYAGNHITSATDPAGHTWSYNYDGSGNLTSATDPLNRTWAFTYDASHLLLTMTDPRGGTTTNVYDGSDRVTSQTDAAGRTTTWSYTGDNSSAGGGTTDVADPRGAVTRYAYSNLELDAITRDFGGPTAATTSYSYDPVTLGVTSQTDPSGNVTQHTYNSDGTVASTRDARGYTTSYSYNGFGEVTSKTDRNGVTTSYIYDANGNLQSVSTPLSGGGTSTSSYTYGSGSEAGDAVSSTNPDGKTTTYGYDGAGDVTSVTDPTGNQITYTYDSDGHQKSKTLPDGGTTSYVYDADGELTKSTDALGKDTSYGYDGDGNQTSLTDGNGHTTTYTYDADNEQTAVNRPDGTTLTTDYDANGNVLKQIDGAGHATVYSYDALNRVAGTTDPDGHTTSDTYDLAGNLATVVDPEGRTTSYGYNQDNQVAQISYSDGTTPTVSESYDPNGQRTSLQDASGTSSFSYDTLGNLTSETSGAGSTIGFGYDDASQLTSITYPNGQTVNRTYNDDGQLKTVADWLGNTTNFAYTGDGNLKTEGLPGSVTAISSYDAADRLNGITDTQAGNPLASFGYNRDAVGQLTQSTATGAISDNRSYSYDGLGRLTADNSNAYGYDAADNPTTFGAQNQTFDAADELQTSGPSSQGGTTTSSTTSTTATTSTVSTSGTTPTVVQPPAPHNLTPGHNKPNRVTVDTAAATHNLGKHHTLSAALTTAHAGDLLLAFVTAQGSGPSTQTATKPRTAGLSWRLITRASGRGELVSIWQARAAAKLSRKLVSTHLTHASSQALLSVVAFAPGSVVGAHARAGKRSGPPRLKLPAVAGAQIYTVGHSAMAGAPKPLPGTKLIQKLASSKLHQAAWVQHSNVARTGSITIGDRGAHTRNWVLAGVVVQPAAAAASSARRPRAVRQLLSDDSGAGSATRSFGYNAEGDRTNVTSTAGSAVSLAYDQANRLVGVGSSISYAYDGDSLRTSKIVGGSTTQFTWDESGDLPQLLQDGSTYYIYGPNGQPIEQISGSAPSYILSDQQGSTRLLTDSSGTVAGTYSYDAWGNITSHTGGTATNLQYDGEYTDAETGYQYLRARYYDPSTGQFASVDPATSATHAPYGYANSSPLNLHDPLGLFSWSHAFKVTGAVVATIGVGAALCVATACVGDAVIGGVALSGVVAATATTAGYTGIAIDTGFTYYDCARGGERKDCATDAVASGLDVVTLGASSYAKYGLNVGEHTRELVDLYGAAAGAGYGYGVALAGLGSTYGDGYPVSSGPGCRPVQGGGYSSAGLLQPAAGANLLQ